MTQLTIGLMAAQSESKFAAAYQAGAHKSTYWEHTYEDMLDVMAKHDIHSAYWIWRAYAKGGRDVWIQATYNPVMDAAGRLVTAAESVHTR